MQVKISKIKKLALHVILQPYNLGSCKIKKGKQKAERYNISLCSEYVSDARASILACRVMWHHVRMGVDRGGAVMWHHVRMGVDRMGP